MHFNLSKSPAPAILPIIMTLTACSGQVRLTSDDGSVKLTYRCSAVTAKAESLSELRVAMRYAAAAARHAATNERMVTAQAIATAIDNQQWQTAEKTTIEYLCEYGIRPTELPNM